MKLSELFSGNRKHFFPFGLALICALVLSGCGEDQSAPKQEEGVLIYAALNPVSSSLKNTVFFFNKSHEDVQIEIKDYSDEGGLERLRTELVLGQVPDIMEMHYYGKAGQRVAAKGNYHVVPGTYEEAEDEYWMPYRQMVQKGYLEDLWPYIEKDPKLGRDGVLPAPLKAAEVNGGLYILFQRAVIFTLTGRESVVGNRYSWTLDELMDIYSKMPEDSTIMRYNMTKQDAFFNLLRFSLDRFVDWGTGACFFDGQGFRDLMGFLEKFPDEIGYEDPVAAEEEIIQNIKYGRQLLEGIMIDWNGDIDISDSIWQERAAFPGYPTTDGSSGSFFYPVGDILAMSSVCRNKDAAWEYIRALIMPRLSRLHPVEPFTSIPVNQHDYDLQGWGEVKQYNELAEEAPDAIDIIYPAAHFAHTSKVPMLYPLTEDHVQRREELINHTTRLYWPDDDLTDIVWEVLGAYFAGDLTLDQAVDRIQNRASLYVNESR